MSNLESIITALDNNPMFHMSLGSKELFHSNFLEFLWHQNSQAFLKMIMAILPQGREYEKECIHGLFGKSNLKLAREKNHFDICIYHKEEGKEIFDIIIENKVKSIPYKSQLDNYVENVGQKHGSPVFILLSLAKEYAQCNEILNQKKWIVIHYDQLNNEIAQHYSSSCTYVNDYCQFIKSLDNLDNIIENCSPGEHEIIYNSLKDIRLHDLFLKLKGSAFIGELHKQIINQIPQEVVTIGSENRKDKQLKVFLSNSFNNGKSTITAAILHDKVFYTIQIEGEQYRHMYNKKDLANKCSGKLDGKINGRKLEKHLCSMQAKNFLLFEEGFKVSQLSNDLNKKYCRYGSDVVYRYKKYSDSDDMLSIMLNDILQTYRILYH